MKISTKGRYGLRVLIDLATHDPEKPRMLKDIARSQQISEKYISRLVINLRRAKLIRSVCCVNGGFYLAKLPERITLLEVLETMEGPISVVDCVRSPEKCKCQALCPARSIWTELNNGIRELTSKITLDEILNAYRRQNAENGICDFKYGGIDFNGVTLIKTDCIHGQPGEIGRLYENLPIRKEACGVMMKSSAEAKTLYLAGDTVWCEYVDAAIRDHRPDVIVVNAARAAVAPFGPIIMGLEDVEKVLAAAPEATVIASHMDNVGHATVWREDIREFAAQHGVTRRLLIPEDGETCCL